MMKQQPGPRPACNPVPPSGAELRSTAAAGLERSSRAVSLSAREEIKTVGLFIPKRLAHRLASAVARSIQENICSRPMSDVDWLEHESMLELKKALERAGYRVPA